MRPRNYHIRLAARFGEQTMRRQNLPRTGRYSFGEVAEWSNAPDSKSGLRLCRNVGSNPTLSARNANAPCGRFAFLKNQAVKINTGPIKFWLAVITRAAAPQPSRVAPRTPSTSRGRPARWWRDWPA